MSNASSSTDRGDVPERGRRLRGTGLPHPVLAFTFAIAVFLSCQIVASLILGLVTTPQTSPIIRQFGFIILAQGMVLASLGVYLRSRKVSWRDIGFRKPVFRDIWVAVVALFVYFTVYAILLQIVGALVPSFNAEQKQDIGFDGASGFATLSLVFLALVVMAPLTEETLLRGFFYGSLRKRHTFLISTLVTSVVFGALHLGGGVQGEGLLWVAAVDTFVLSVALCYLREHTNGIWSSILLHAAKNGVAFTLLFVLAVNG